MAVVMGDIAAFVFWIAFASAMLVVGSLIAREPYQVLRAMFALMPIYPRLVGTWFPSSKLAAIAQYVTLNAEEGSSVPDAGATAWPYVRRKMRWFGVLQALVGCAMLAVALVSVLIAMIGTIAE
jgi:hypothetical protein